MYDDVKHQVAVANRVLAKTGLASGVLAANGHASLRVPASPEHFVIKGRGYAIDALSRMRARDMIVCDLEGFLVEGPPGGTQPFEVKMHSCIYRTYPEVQSIVHVHPRYIVVISVLEETIVPMCQEGIQLVRNPLPMYPHVKTIQTDEEGMDVANLLGDGKAVLLQGHGATTVGSSLEESVMNMLQLEEQAKMNWYALCAKGSDHKRIGDDRIAEMTERTPLRDLPHFQDVMRAGQPRLGGVYAHFSEIVAHSI